MSGRLRFLGGIAALVIGMAVLAPQIWAAPVNDKPVMILGRGLRRSSFSPDDRWCAVGSEAGRLSLWDNWNGALVRDFIGHTELIQDVRFSADGESLYSVADDNSLRRWDVATGRQLACQVWPDDPPRSVDVNTSGTRLAVIRKSGLIQFCDLSTADPISTVTALFHDSYSRIRFSPLGNYLLVKIGFMSMICDLQGARLWNGSHFNLIGMNKDEKSFVYEDYNKTLHQDCLYDNWSLNSLGNETIKSGQIPGYRPAIDGYIPETNEILIEGIDHKDGNPIYTPEAYNVLTGESRILSGPKYSLQTVKMSRDGQLIEATSFDGTIWAWSAADGQLKRKFDICNSPRGGIEFSKDGTRLLSCAQDTKIWEYEFPSGKILHEFALNEWRPYQYWQYAHFTNDQTKIAACEFDGNVKVWNAVSGELLCQKMVNEKNYFYNLRDLVCPPSTDSLVLMPQSFERQGPILYDWHTSMTTQVGPNDWFPMLFPSKEHFYSNWNPNDHVLSGILHDVSWPDCIVRRELSLTGDGAGAVDISPDGRRAVASQYAYSSQYPGYIDIIDLDKFSIARTVNIDTYSENLMPYWIKFLPDGQRFIVSYMHGSYDRDVVIEAELRSANTGELIESFDAPGYDSHDGAISPDGRYYAMAQDFCVYIYELPAPNTAMSWALYE